MLMLPFIALMASLRTGATETQQPEHNVFLTRPQTPLSPPPMAFAAAGVIGDDLIIFGGCTDPTCLAISRDTWALNLRTESWRRLASSLASSVSTAGQGQMGQAAVVNNTMYIFGGLQSGVNTASTNLFALNFVPGATTASWSRVGSNLLLNVLENHPKERYLSSLAAYGDDGLIVFGGYSLEVPPEPARPVTYLFNITTSKWKVLASARDEHPQPRVGQTLTPIPGTNTMLLQGGTNPTHFCSYTAYFPPWVTPTAPTLNDSWLLTIDENAVSASWTPLVGTHAPPSAFGAAAPFSFPDASGVYLLPGLDRTGACAQYECPTAFTNASSGTFSYRQVTSNDGRLPAMVGPAVAASDTAIYIFGGLTQNGSPALSQSLSKVSLPDFTFRSVVLPTSISGRMNPLVFNFGERTFVGFGSDSQGGVLNDMWCLQAQHPTFTNNQNSETVVVERIHYAPQLYQWPSARVFACVMTFGDETAVAFGGHVPTTNLTTPRLLQDTWRFQGDTLQWQQLNHSREVPPARAFCATATLGTQGFLYGGLVLSLVATGPQHVVKALPFVTVDLTVDTDLWLWNNTSGDWTTRVPPTHHEWGVWPEPLVRHSVLLTNWYSMLSNLTLGARITTHDGQPLFIVTVPIDLPSDTFDAGYKWWALQLDTLHWSFVTTSLRSSATSWALTYNNLPVSQVGAITLVSTLGTLQSFGSKVIFLFVGQDRYVYQYIVLVQPPPVHLPCTQQPCITFFGNLTVNIFKLHSPPNIYLSSIGVVTHVYSDGSLSLFGGSYAHYTRIAPPDISSGLCSNATIDTTLYNQPSYTQEYPALSMTLESSGCPFGSYASNFLFNSCLACPQGTFSNVTGATVCYACPGVTTTPTLGATQQSDCQLCPDSVCHNNGRCVLDYVDGDHVPVCSCATLYTAADKCRQPWILYGGLTVLAVLGLLVALLLRVNVLARRRRAHQRSEAAQKEALFVAEMERDTYSLVNSQLRAAGRLDARDVVVDERLPVLGRGGFGIVRKGMLYGTLSVAVKELRVGADATLDEDAEFQREVETLQTLRHENVVRFFGYGTRVAEGTGESVTILVTEYCSHGSLFDVLYVSSLELPWELRLRFTLDIALGMRYLHSDKRFESLVVIHRDLKSANVLVADVGHTLRAKITDFGLSCSVKITETVTDLSTRANAAGSVAMRPIRKHRWLPWRRNSIVHQDEADGEESLSQLEEPLLASTSALDHETNGVETMQPAAMTKGVCTARWRAPELWPTARSVDGNGRVVYTNKIDVFAFAMVMYEIAARSLPFEQQFTQNAPSFDLGQHIVGGGRPSVEGVLCSDGFRRIMIACWAPLPSERPNFRDIVDRLDEIRRMQQQ